MECKCNAWKTNSLQITRVFLNSKNHGIEYKGTPFSFCPWCGKELKGKED